MFDCQCRVVRDLRPQEGIFAHLPNVIAFSRPVSRLRVSYAAKHSVVVCEYSSLLQMGDGQEHDRGPVGTWLNNVLVNDGVRSAEKEAKSQEERCCHFRAGVTFSFSNSLAKMFCRECTTKL